HQVEHVARATGEAIELQGENPVRLAPLDALEGLPKPRALRRVDLPAGSVLGLEGDELIAVGLAIRLEALSLSVEGDALVSLLLGAHAGVPHETKGRFAGCLPSGHWTILRMPRVGLDVNCTLSRRSRRRRALFPPGWQCDRSLPARPTRGMLTYW